MNSEVYVIPTNFTDAGRILGLFERRNLIEVVILTVPIIYVCLAMLPFDLTARIAVMLALVVPVGGFGLIGVGGDCLSRWLKSWWLWRRRRRVLYYRGEERT